MIPQKLRVFLLLFYFYLLFWALFSDNHTERKSKGTLDLSDTNVELIFLILKSILIYGNYENPTDTNLSSASALTE